MGAKRVFIMSIQAPFAVPTTERLTEVLTQHGSELVGGLIYDKDKTSYRSEVDQALRTQPDMIYLNGYAPDVDGAAARAVSRRISTAPRFTQSYALTEKALDALPQEVTEKVYHGAALRRSRLAGLRARRRSGWVAEPDSYEAQATDWISLVALDDRQGQGGDRHGAARQRPQGVARATGRRSTPRWRG